MNIIKPFVNVVDFNEHEMLRGIFRYLLPLQCSR